MNLPFKISATPENVGRLNSLLQAIAEVNEGVTTRAVCVYDNKGNAHTEFVPSDQADVVQAAADAYKAALDSARA